MVVVRVRDRNTYFVTRLVSISVSAELRRLRGVFRSGVNQYSNGGERLNSESLFDLYMYQRLILVPHSSGRKN